jgi:hypothetical protein
MRKAISVLLLIPVLAGCGILKGRSAAPDEFQVARNAPLVIPPDYTLTPPSAGAATSSPTDAQSQAIEALFGGPAPRSTSELLMLEKAGRDHAALGARSVAGDPDTKVFDKGAVTTAILAAPQADGTEASAEVPQ